MAKRAGHKGTEQIDSGLFLSYSCPQKCVAWNISSETNGDVNNLPLLIAPELLSVGNVFHLKILFFPILPPAAFPAESSPQKSEFEIRF